MADEQTSFLSLDEPDEEICMICEKTILDKISQLTDKGWINFKKQAEQWQKIAIPETEEKYIYTKVYNKIANIELAFGFVHLICRTHFRTKLSSYQEKYKQIEDITDDEINAVEIDLNTSQSRTTCKRKSTCIGKLCFICVEKRYSDSYALNQGGLGRCTEERARTKIEERLQYYLTQPNHRFSEAAKRLEIMLSGAHDIFAADIFYHQSCYIKFAINNIAVENETIIGNSEILASNILSEFLYKIERQIIFRKSAYLLSSLLKDLLNSYEEHASNHIIDNTRQLKRKLIETFGDKIDFFPSGRQVIVYSCEVNPCQYSVATIKGFGLNDDDITRAFGNMIRRKIKDLETNNIVWPYSPEEVSQVIECGPLPELYNVICATMKPALKISETGYAITPSHQVATKIWSLASDWQSLLTKTVSPKQAITGVTLHRLTGNKEVINSLHKMNHCISYADVRLQNKEWVNNLRSKWKAPKGLVKGIATHATLDNNDGKEETTTGRGTTHDTNFTMFQPVFEGETFPTYRDEVSDNDEEEETNEENETPEYIIGARKTPPLFPSHKDNEDRDLLELSLKKDIAWSIVEGLEIQGATEQPIGSWTCFNKETTKTKALKSIVEYLPMVPEPPEYPVCKKFLDDLLDMMKELDLDHIFAHADELVYSKLAHIIWKHPDIYGRVIIIMGGFHQLRVRQRIIYKRFACLGYKNWFIDSGIIASGSADHSIEGGHYYRHMRITKESFSALIQNEVAKITSNFTDINETLKTLLIELKNKRTPQNLENVLCHESFEKVVSSLLYVGESTQRKMTVAYLKDVSSILALVAGVRSGNFDLHMQAERDMLNYCFAFDHINYSRYLSYQHVYLQNLQEVSHPAIDDLVNRGLGGSLSGSPFSSIHGDLITEVFNGETKRQAGPHRSGFSTNVEAVNTWIKTAHIHAKVRQTFCQKIKLSTSSVHKETTKCEMTRHKKHVQALKDQLKKYEVDPFSNDEAKDLTTGKEIDKKIINGLLNAENIGKAKYKEFVQERLVEGNKTIFDPITKVNIDIGIKKKKKVNKTISILKEDRQAFGLLLSKAIDINDAMKYPLTSLPLSLATADGSLRQSNKSILRNYLIEEASAVEVNADLTNSRWIIDGMAVIRTLKPVKTYEKFFENLLKNNIPSLSLLPLQVEIVNDVYKKESVKGNTRSKRGLTSQRTNLNSVHQHMLKAGDWSNFFNNIENKSNLLNLLVQYCKSDTVKSKLDVPIVINDQANTWKISSSSTQKIFECNHEEADTRLVLHALLEDTKSVIVSKDTDVLILLIYAFATFRPMSNWFMKIDFNKYVNIRKIVDHFGLPISKTLPHIHAVTGCDTTSYLYGVGKVKVLKKLQKSEESLNLIENLGATVNITEDIKEDAVKFIQCLCYSGNLDESLVETRVRLYKSMKTKSSQSLPADPSSLEQHILRVHYQLWFWRQLNTKVIQELQLDEYGWSIQKDADSSENYVVPTWYLGEQLPPFKTKASKRKRTDDLHMQDEIGILLNEEEIDLNFAYFSSSSEDEDSDASDWEA